jgi:gamma-glutamylcyclotransferase (GGCT)/AIG2-like uncharacterized protein YtfP
MPRVALYRAAGWSLCWYFYTHDDTLFRLRIEPERGGLGDPLPSSRAFHVRSSHRRNGDDTGSYVRSERWALTPNGDAIRVFTYEAPSRRRERYVRPTRSYLETVHVGLAAFGLASDMLQCAAEDRAGPGPLDTFFVYGTLMQGESNHALIGEGRIDSVVPASIPGRLFTTQGDYPGLRIHAEFAADRVIGELIRVADPLATLQRLDRLEGFCGFGASGNLYERRLMEVDTGKGGIQRAWVYVAGDSLQCGEPITQGCWRTFRDV